jgi:ribose-phosphate pyrophosphokinase
MVDAARRASSGRINAVMPFFGYARQDRKDQPRVPITAKLIANLLTEAGVDRVITMDLHAPQIQGFFDIPVDHLYAKPALIGYLREQGIGANGNLTVVSPDVGGVKMARAYADALCADLAIVAKHRISATKVEAMNIIGEVQDRDVLLVDDMTETAGTLCAAAEILKRNGARRIYAGVSHAVLGDLGTKSKSMDRQLTFVSKMQDSLEVGIGNLVDADLAKESARLTALQTKQQLGVQALSIANQSSSILLGLFR